MTVKWNDPSNREIFISLMYTLFDFNLLPVRWGIPKFYSIGTGKINGDIC